jgi:hypothetical protein
MTHLREERAKALIQTQTHLTAYRKALADGRKEDARTAIDAALKSRDRVKEIDAEENREFKAKHRQPPGVRRMERSS